MTAAHAPVPDGDGVDVDTIEAVLADHDAYTGPVSGAWACSCGERSTNGTMAAGDLTDREERRAEYRAHLAAALSAALASQPAQSGDTVAEAVAAVSAYQLGVRDAQQVVAGEDTIEWARNADRSNAALSWLIEGMDDLLDDVDEIVARIARDGVTG